MFGVQVVSVQRGCTRDATHLDWFPSFLSLCCYRHRLQHIETLPDLPSSRETGLCGVSGSTASSSAREDGWHLRFRIGKTCVAFSSDSSDSSDSSAWSWPSGPICPSWSSRQSCASCSSSVSMTRRDPSAGQMARHGHRPRRTPLGTPPLPLWSISWDVLNSKLDAWMLECVG